MSNIVITVIQNNKFCFPSLLKYYASLFQSLSFDILFCCNLLNQMPIQISHQISFFTIQYSSNKFQLSVYTKYIIFFLIENQRKEYVK